MFGFRLSLGKRHTKAKVVLLSILIMEIGTWLLGEAYEKKGQL
jgi:hypothetical protein